MTQEKLKIYQELLASQVNYWVIFSISLTVSGIFGQAEPNLFLWVPLSIYPFLLFLIRYYTNGFPVFALSHGAGIALWLLLPMGTLPEQIAAGMTGIVFTIYSVSRRLKDGKGVDGVFAPPFAVGVIAVMCILQQSTGSKEWNGYYTGIAVASLCAYMAFYYIDRFGNFLKVNARSTGYIPARSMFRSGMGMTGFYCITGGLLLILCGNDNLSGKIVEGLKFILFIILRFLFSFLGGHAEEGRPAAEAAPPSLPPETAAESAAPSIFWEVLEKIIYVIFIALAVVCVVTLVIRIYGLIREAFRRRSGESSQAAEGIQDIRERCVEEKKKNKKQQLLYMLSPSGRIRKIYRKKVVKELKHRNGGGELAELLPLTPRECCRRLSAEQLAGIYEKARYSSEECTAEDLKEAGKWR